MPLLEGDTLGEKHLHFNKLVTNAVASKHYELTPISDTDSDIENLLKVEMACKIRIVDYIIEVMKSKDMLYAATAIKKSTWLITDPQYANIINPVYLHTQLKPYMTTKAFNKLMLHIRLNMKDETRIETFYEHFKETDKACKWLQNCSISFIENVIKNERLVPIWLFKRLCLRSAQFLSYHNRVDCDRFDLKRVLLLFLKRHTTDVLDILDKTITDMVFYPYMYGKKTEIILKTCPQRVFDNKELFDQIIDLSVIAKFTKVHEVTKFIYKIAKDKGHQFNNYEKFCEFMKGMSKNERFEVVKRIFSYDTPIFLMTEERKIVVQSEFIRTYQCYEQGPFNVAFLELTKLIREATSVTERWDILKVLLTCAKNNCQHIKTLLQLIVDNHINDDFKFKIKFINNLLSNVLTHEVDKETWNLLNQLFQNIEVYTEKKNGKNKVQQCRDAIFLYNVLHDEPLPEIIKEGRTFNTFPLMQRTLSEEQKLKLFTYILDTAKAKIKTKNIVSESDFNKTLHNIENVLILLKDWNKILNDYPFVLANIQELIKIKEEKNWVSDMSFLYYVNKSWRKYMFEESLSLSLCEETCLNALKHKPQLLKCRIKQIHTLRLTHPVSLQRVVAKLRIYWLDSIARDWIETYMKSLDEPTRHKAIIKDLFILLPKNEVINLAKKYVPKSFEIKSDPDVSIRKYIAKHLHIARPLVPLDTVLWYAKGDYLQYAIPSLNTILLNLSENECRPHILELLHNDNARPLKTLGMRLVLLKIKTCEFNTELSQVLKIEPNMALAFFRFTCKQMCATKNPACEKELWPLLNLIMNELNVDIMKSKTLKDLCLVEKFSVLNIQIKFFKKSYNVLASLPINAENERYLIDLLAYGPKIMKWLDEDFIFTKVLSPVEIKFCLQKRIYLEMFACYILWGDSEEKQFQRLKKIEPALEEAFRSWHKIISGELYIQYNIFKFLWFLVYHTRKIVVFNDTPLPVKLFKEILSKLENGLPLLEKYVLCTSWKLSTVYVELMEDYVSKTRIKALADATELDGNYEYDWYESVQVHQERIFWSEMHCALLLQLCPIVVECLKEDIERYGSTIYSQFAEALQKFFELLCLDKGPNEILEYMSNQDFVPCQLVVDCIFM